MKMKKIIYILAIVFLIINGIVYALPDWCRVIGTGIIECQPPVENVDDHYRLWYTNQCSPKDNEAGTIQEPTGNYLRVLNRVWPCGGYSNAYRTEKIYIKFMLQNQGLFNDVNNVKLRLYHPPSYCVTILPFVYCNTAPVSTSPQLVNAGNNWYEVNATDYYNNWISDNSDQYLVISPAGSGTPFAAFYSSDYGNVNYRPKLIIEYSGCLEGDTRDCINQNGVCAGSQESCVGNQWSGCDYSSIDGYEEIEVSCDDLDNDCNGVVDGMARDTSCGVGACSGNTGVEICTTGVWGEDSCDPLNGAGAEICDDGMDNDCDSLLDCGDSDCSGDSFCSGGCDCGGVDCNPLYDGTVCDGCNYIDAADEVCDDGIDNDCDSLTDCNDGDCFDYFDCDRSKIYHNSDAPVRIEVGLKVQYYNGLVWVDEDMIIDDREFIINPDEYLALDDLWNSAGWSADNTGIRHGHGNHRYAAVVGVVYNDNYNNPLIVMHEFNVLIPSNEDVCDDGYDYDFDGCVDSEDSDCGGIEIICNNGVDDDCDNLVDCGDGDCSSDSYCGGCSDGEIRNCIKQSGVCAGSQESCVGNQWSGCDYSSINGYEETEVSCDDLDNDCNGVVDGMARDTSCGVGACSGNTGVEICTTGVWGEDSCDPLNGAVAEICDDGLDNDCDSLSDCNDDDCSSDSFCSGGCDCGGVDCNPLYDGTICDGCNYIDAADEVCDDSVDNDCDSLTDCNDGDCSGDAYCSGCSDGDFRDCSNQNGVCLGIIEVCIDGEWSGCDYSEMPDYEEIEVSCDDLLDNDCDDDVDSDDSDCEVSDDETSGGGSSGGGSSSVSVPASEVIEEECMEDWICDDWSPAICPVSGVQTRNCEDWNKCGTMELKPGTSRSCVYMETVLPSCSDGIRNQDEIGIDCGGPCRDCATCYDGIKNQDEIGIDCGGFYCEPCVESPKGFGKSIWLVLLILLVVALGSGAGYYYWPWISRKLDALISSRGIVKERDLADIENYVRRMEKLSYNEQQILNSLVKAGWKQEQVNMVMHRVHKPTGNFINLVDYIRKCRGMGYSDDKIRMILLRTGWNAMQINRAFGLRSVKGNNLGF